MTSDVIAGLAIWSHVEIMTTRTYSAPTGAARLDTLTSPGRSILREATFGDMLRAWRTRRRFSQLALGLEANVSARHISFLENGRSQPSREMVLMLGRVLEAPLADRNAMLNAAGFSPAFRAEGLDGPHAGPIRRALHYQLRGAHPYPAVVVDQGWNVQMANDAYVGVVDWLHGRPVEPMCGDAIHDQPPVRGSNLVLPMFENETVRDALPDFPRMAAFMVGYLRRAARDDDNARAILERIDAAGTLPTTEDVDISLPVIAPAVLEARGRRMSFFATMTTIGPTSDMLLSSLRLQTFFPADDDTEATVRALIAKPDR